jgi:Protein of unknown function (DUF642)
MRHWSVAALSVVASVLLPETVVGAAATFGHRIVQPMRLHGASNCPAAPGGSGILTDGDFSQAPYPGTHVNYRKGQMLAPDWFVTRHNIDFSGTDFNTPGGLCMIDLDGTRNGGRHSVGAVAHAPIPTTPGAMYTLTFLFSANGCAPGPTIKVMRIQAGHERTDFQWDISNGHDAEHGDYDQESWTFTATDSYTRLSFRSLDPEPSNCGPVIGALSLIQGTNQ